MSVWTVILIIIAAIVGMALLVSIWAFIKERIDEKNSNVHSKLLYERFIKRPLECFLSTGAIIVFSPILLITSVMVRIKLGSPVFYNQQRVGKDEIIFKNYKFRTMTDERDDNGNLLSDEIRLTSFGKKLRSSSLDELPELINIIKGDMAIIGPRPLPPVYLPYYKDEERCRHNVRPGLTGLAQANGRNSISWDDKFKFDIEYVEHITFIGDVNIIFKTVAKVFKHADIGQGEEHPGNLYDIRADMLQEKEALVNNN